MLTSPSLMKTPHSPPPRWLTALCFLFPFGLYFVTAARTVQGGDAGEFGLIGMVGGVAHPPGYPLYTLLMRAMSALPINPPFLRIALTSSLCGAAATAVLQRVAWRLTGSVAASGVTALSFGLCAILWRLSGVPEVFALHALLVGLAVLFTVRVIQSPLENALGEASWLGLVLGLGMSNHMTTALCAPLALGALVSIGQRGGLSRALKALGALLGASILGLSPYLLLIAWGHLDPLHAWAWGKTATFDGFWRHVLRREYGTFQLSAGNRAADSDRWHWVLTFTATLPKQFAYAFFGAGVAGVLIGWRRDRLFVISLLASFGLAGVVFPAIMRLPPNAIDTEVADRFFLMPLVLFAPFIAYGLAQAESSFKRLPLVPVSALLLAANTFVTFPSVNWRADTNIRRYLIAAVTNLPPNAIILGRTDTLMPGFGWVSRVLHIRPDVHYIDVNLIGERWFYDRVQREIPGFPIPFRPEKAHPGEMGLQLSPFAPVYVVPWTAQQAREVAKLEPDGLLYRIEQTPRTVPPQEFQAYLDRDMKVLGGNLPDPVDAWSAEIREAAASPWADLMDDWKTAGNTAQYEAAMKEAAELLPPPQPGDNDDNSDLRRPHL